MASCPKARRCSEPDERGSVTVPHGHASQIAVDCSRCTAPCQQSGSCRRVKMLLMHLARPGAICVLPDLSVDKSGRACHPAAPRARRSSRKSSTGRFLIAHHPLGRRVPRPPRQARPDFPAIALAQPPLPFGLRLRATDRATLHWSVTLSVRAHSGRRCESQTKEKPMPARVGHRPNIRTITMAATAIVAMRSSRDLARY